MLISVQNSGLEDHIEIGCEMPSALAEEKTKSRVGDIGMNCLRVVMIRQIVSTDRESQRILWIHLEVFRDSGINRKEIREPVLIGHADVILECVCDGVWESASIFNDRSDLESVRKLY